MNSRGIGNLAVSGRNDWARPSWRDGARAHQLPRYRFPAEIISHAIWLYDVFSLSLRDVELILAERGSSTTTARPLEADMVEGYAAILPSTRPGLVAEARFEEPRAPAVLAIVSRPSG